MYVFFCSKNGCFAAETVSEDLNGSKKGCFAAETGSEGLNGSKKAVLQQKLYQKA